MQLSVWISCALSLVVMGIGWRFTRGVPIPFLRALARVALVGAVALAWPRLVVACAEPIDHGSWRCTVCGQSVERLRYGGITVMSRDDRDPSTAAKSAREFEAWYRACVGAAHEHDWIPVGCHSVGSSVHCSSYPAREYWCALPKLRDRSIALAMVARVASWDPATRRRELRSFERVERAPIGPPTRDEARDQELLESGDPWRSVCEGAPPSDAELARLYAKWLDVHPSWR
jgi:hypothetical protein